MLSKNRPLFFLERTLVGNGTQPFNGVFAFRIDGMVEQDTWIEALDRLQQKFPQLQMAIGDLHTSKPYFFIPAVVHPIVVHFKVRDRADAWQDEALKGLGHVFDVRQGTLIRLVCLVDDEKTDVILTFHHAICDGGGGVLLVRYLLQLLDDPDADIGACDTLLNLSDIIPQKVLNNKKIRLKTTFVAATLKTALSLFSWFGFHRKGPTYTRERDYLLHSKLTQSTTIAWIRMCREASVTVNTAIGLLLLEAFRTVRDKEAKNKVTCPVDIRKFAPEIAADRLFSFGLMLTLTEPNKDDPFWKKAVALQKKVDKQINSLQPYEFLMTFEKLHNRLPQMLQLLTYGKVNNDLMFSNMGNLPLTNTYQHFQLETIFSPMVIGPFANPSTVICSTFNKQLDIAFVSNHDFLPKEDARQILKYVVDSMRKMTS